MMEPALKAGLSLYEAGGLALVMLAIIVAGAYFMFRFLFGQINSLGARLNAVQDAYTDKTVSVMEEVSHQSRRAADTNIEILANLRSRKCLIDETPTDRRTPLPALRN
jgi:hypothetical protein